MTNGMAEKASPAGGGGLGSNENDMLNASEEYEHAEMENSDAVSSHQFAQIDQSGICFSCEDADASESSLNCLCCNVKFHAICTTATGDRKGNDIICHRTFFNMYKSMIESQVYKNRPGNFPFICNLCIIKVGHIEATDQHINTTDQGVNTSNDADKEIVIERNNLQDRVESLSSEVTNLKDHISTEMASLKDVVNKLVGNAATVEQSPSHSSGNIANSYADAVTKSLPPEQKQQLIHISTKDANGLSAEAINDKVKTVKSKLSQSLKEIPTNFVKANNLKGSITVAFPHATSREKGSKIIEDLDLSASGFDSKNGTKMLPKLTIQGIESSIFENIDTSLSPADKRAQQKQMLKASIISKNACEATNRCWSYTRSCIHQRRKLQ